MNKALLFILVFFLSLIGYAQEKPEGLFINSKAPDFKGKDQDGNEVRLKDQLKKGSVVLVFYRGEWCPYCNKHLRRLQDSLSLITEKGAQLIAITPEKSESVSKTREKTGATFTIISDEKQKIMKAYDVSFALDEKTIKRYKSFDIDIEGNNGDNGAFLPVPAIYIINKEGSITYRYFDADYKKRPSVKEILENL